MGWLLSITMLITYLFTNNSEHLTASYIFAIAGAIETVATSIKSRF